VKPSASTRVGSERSPDHRVVRVLPFVGDDDSFVEALRAGHPGANAVLFDRYGAHVERVLTRLLGVDPEVPDLAHEVFARAFAGASGIRDAASLGGWITSIAVFTARECIRRRSRRRWLRFFSFDALPETPAPVPTPEVTEALRQTYAILNELSADERIALALRIIEGMNVTEVAEACQVSLSTIKRRLGRAEAKFLELARQRPSLQDWLQDGHRWGNE
jgi:RNA polymerase sigma-70 factor (ECF subfamily)